MSENSSKRICLCIILYEDKIFPKCTFSLEEALLWIMARSNVLKLNYGINDGFDSYKHKMFGFTRC